jgi:iron-sulfur cluster assembly protein
MDKITKDMMIGEIVEKYPESTGIMLSYGLHCVGCAVNPFESIENGCLGHGMNEETVEKLVADLNKNVKEKKEPEFIISITTFAATKIKEFMKEEGKECGVKVNVFGGGCSGFQYGLDFADTPTASEEVVENHGIKFFVEKSLVNKIKGTQIDFVENENGSGFRITNQNTSGHECGCSTEGH